MRRGLTTFVAQALRRRNTEGPCQLSSEDGRTRSLKIFTGTRWTPLIREFLGRAHRELRITLTPLVRPEKWVFVVGCYNSGTELLMNLLDAHAAISSLPTEGQFLTDQLPRDYDLGVPRMWVLREDVFRLNELDDGPDVVRLKKEWLSRVDLGNRIFVEKSPPNAARTRWLQAHFENAHFIAIVRNGYAVAEGIRRKAEPHHLSGGWPIDLSARQWNRSNEILLCDAEHLDRIRWTRYEDLVESPERELGRLLEFLDLPASDVSSIDPRRPRKIHERQEPLRNLNAESIARLTPDELRVVTREAGAMLEHFEYPILT